MSITILKQEITLKGFNNFWFEFSAFVFRTAFTWNGCNWWNIFKYVLKMYRFNEVVSMYYEVIGNIYPEKFYPDIWLFGVPKSEIWIGIILLA